MLMCKDMCPELSKFLLADLEITQENNIAKPSNSIK